MPTEEKTQEQKRPMMLDDIPAAMVEAVMLQRRKGADYNSGVRLEDYFPFGVMSYTQELHKKTLRLVSLCRTAQHGAPNNESVRDTALDIINYASFLVAAIDEGKLRG